jgi:hypothetical protein
MVELSFGAKPEPAWNQEVTRSHAGEDGPCWRTETHREMFIDDQAWSALLHGCAMWALYESMGDEE